MFKDQVGSKANSLKELLSSVLGEEGNAARLWPLVKCASSTEVEYESPA